MTHHDWDDLLDAVTDIDPPTLSRGGGRGTTVREYVLLGIVVVLAVAVYVFVW